MTNSYLLFQLSGHVFGVRLVGAIEILPWRIARAVPLSHDYVEGLLDYRGTLYPVFNLLRRLGLFHDGEGAAGERSIILLEENKKSFGIAVDSVLKMTRLEEHAASPETIREIDPRYVKGCVYEEGTETMILDFERLFYAD